MIQLIFNQESANSGRDSHVALLVPQAATAQGWGAENLWAGLINELRARLNIQAELISVSCLEESLEQILQSYAKFAKLDLTSFDRVISTKYPAWAATHRNHIVYLQHTLRGLYDTYPCDLGFYLPINLQNLVAGRLPSELAEALQLASQPRWSGVAREKAVGLTLNRYPDGIVSIAPVLTDLVRSHPVLATFPGSFARACVRLFDAISFSGERVSSFFAISGGVRNREDYFPSSAMVRVRHHPSSLPVFPTDIPDKKRCLIVTASRLESSKRIDLLIQAYRESGLTCPFWIIGEGPAASLLKELAADIPAIIFKGRLSDDELIKAYQSALFVPFVPRDEDYGLITVESFMAGAAVLTTTDAGGPTEIVQHGVNGWVSAPNAQSLAHGFRMLTSNPSQTQAWGKSGQQRVSHLSWRDLTDDLLAAEPAKALRILVLNTFPTEPVNSGGKLRMRCLYGELSRFHQVHMICLGPANSKHESWDRRSEEPGRFTEEIIPAGSGFSGRAKRLSEKLGQSADDVAFLLYANELSEFSSALLRALKGADLVVFSHPYVFPLYERAVEIQPDLVRPVVYEAHNVESVLKTSRYPRGAALSAVLDVERRLLAAASLVVACSADDVEQLKTIQGHEPANKSVKFVVCPNGVSATPRISRSLGERLDLSRKYGFRIALFIGSDHGPNHDAIRQIMKACKSQSVATNWRFVVLGSICDKWAQSPDAAGAGHCIYWGGVVSDAEKNAWLGAATVGLNPMASGSGTNLKLAEYASANLLCVSTAFGARGGHWRPGEHYYLVGSDLARDLTDLAEYLPIAAKPDGVLDDLNDMVARARIVASQLSWSSIAQDYAAALSNHAAGYEIHGFNLAA